MFPQPIVLREQEQRTGLVAVVYSLSSIKAVPTTPVQRVALLLEGRWCSFEAVFKRDWAYCGKNKCNFSLDKHINIFLFPFFLVSITS